MTRLRLALVTLSAGLLMAPGVGNVTVGDGTATLNIGDQSIGDRSGCPDYPAAPTIHYAGRLETSFVDNDPVGTLKDFGSLGQDATQATGSQQPTFQSPCDVGGTNQPCIDSDGGDFLQTAAFAAQSQPATACGVWGYTVDSNMYLSDGITLTDRNTIFRAGSQIRFYAGSNISTGVDIPINTLNWTCATFNGASSRITINGTEYTGNPGTETLTGVTLLAAANQTVTAEVLFSEWVFFNSDVDHAAAAETFDCHYGAGWPKS